MKLTAQQAAQFQRDGFLVFPELFSQAEIDVLRTSSGSRALSARRADSPLPARRTTSWVKVIG
jgi:hypothetical protein